MMTRGCLFALLLLWNPALAVPQWLAKLQNKAPPAELTNASATATTITSLTDSLRSMPWYVTWLLMVLVACLTAALYFLHSIGALDRPRFVLRASTVRASEEEHPYWQKHDPRTEYLYAIVALSTDPAYGKVITRLLPATAAAVGAAIPEGACSTAAARYGAPAGADSLSVALYLDDPAVVPKQPRWALGWVVAATDFQQARIWAAVAQREWREPEPLVAVRLGGGRVLQARVPWRHVLTPAIAPYLHWAKGFRAYHKLYPDRPSPPCAEFYVTGAGQSRHAIDYVIWLDDITHTWQDCGFD